MADDYVKEVTTKTGKTIGDGVRAEPGEHRQRDRPKAGDCQVGGDGFRHHFPFDRRMLFATA